MKKSIFVFLIYQAGFSIFFPTFLLPAAGRVYLVLGSDTAIRNGMDTRRFHCYDNIDLYTNPVKNAYQVMAPAFRQRLVDSYGTPLKLTWWMMAGKIFCYATNTNVPLANTMTLYLMQTCHGDAIRQHGDELSLHYHTFFWCDYDGDGLYWWNQAKSFLECRDDFDMTLAQYLLEQNVHPVSFRSGWHYMDNDWQHYLEQLLPYSMHNDWPNVRIDTTEPLDNLYDWSQAPEEFVPYQPSPQNYQVPGAGRGWNVRSKHLSHFSQNLMDKIFDPANQGIDQVACIWGHLPETDFLENLEKIHTSARAAAAKYPKVKFRYCTAIEAMQRWLGTTDTTAPALSLSEEMAGDNVIFTIQTNKAIFQTVPVVAIKDIYERSYLTPVVANGSNEWQTTEPLAKNLLARVAVTVTDTVGNLATRCLCYLPDDIYIDNSDAAYTETRGTWVTCPHKSWGSDARMARLVQDDSASVRWTPNIPQSGHCNVFVQVPAVAHPANQVLFRLYCQSRVVVETIFIHPLPSMAWLYVGTAQLNATDENTLEMIAFGKNQAEQQVAADVVKFSPLVRNRELHVDRNFLDLGPVSQEDTLLFQVTVGNRGLESLAILTISSANQTVAARPEFPVVIPPMQSQVIPLQFYPGAVGVVCDTLWIFSDDPVKPKLAIPMTADVQSYFVIIDNDDSLQYHEEGSWNYSNAQASANCSRYSYLQLNPAANARFVATLTRNGVYEIFEIVPTTTGEALPQTDKI